VPEISIVLIIDTFKLALYSESTVILKVKIFPKYNHSLGIIILEGNFIGKYLFLNLIPLVVEFLSPVALQKTIKC